jgi:signal transduction histidine kinase
MRAGVSRFLEDDIKSVDYYREGYTPNTLELESLDLAIDSTMESAGSIASQLDFQLREELSQVKNTLETYRSQMAELKIQVTRLGFKDFGFEGRMREVVHELETKKLLKEQVYLALRRHEKDFIMRGEKVYAESVVKVSEAAMVERYKLGDTAATIRLGKYREIFANYVRIYEEIYDRDTGLRSRVTKSGQESENACTRFVQKVSVMSSDKISALKLNIMWVSAIGLLLGFLISFYVGQNLANPLRRLARYMDGYVVDAQQSKLVLPGDEVPSEIAIVANSFNALTTQIDRQIREISQQNNQLEHQNSELKKLNAEMDKFIYHTSHDLRSPLTSIAGLVELIKMEGGDASEDYLNYITQSIQRLDGTIQEIIHFYRNRNTPMSKELFSIKQLYLELCEQYRFSADARHISFLSNFQHEYLLLDKYRVRIILRNLISNSVKYHDLSKKPMYVKCESTRAGDDLHISIADNGQGIDKALVPRIFEMFYRATDQSQGSGLGLFIVQESVERIGGKIAASSTLGVGSVFTLTLPLYFKEMENQVELVATPFREAPGSTSAANGATPS